MDDKIIESKEDLESIHNNLKKNCVHIHKDGVTNLEKEKEITPETEALYHYCFDIDEENLKQRGVKENNIGHFKTLVITALADKIARELKDTWLIVHGNQKHVLVYDEQKNTEKIEDEIITYFIKTDRIPEDTLYLGENGLELYSKSVQKIEKHKLRLEYLIENIERLLPELINTENNEDKKESAELIELNKIIECLDALPIPEENINTANKIKKIL